MSTPDEAHESRPRPYWLPSYIAYEKDMAAKYGKPTISRIDNPPPELDGPWFWQCWCTIWGTCPTWSDASLRLELHMFSGEHVVKPFKA